MFINIFYLSLVQITNYVFPLITLPYLVRVLGVSQFGGVMLAQAVIHYCIIITDYGFNLSATKKITLANGKDNINSIYTSTFYARLLLSFLCLCAILILIYCFGLFYEQRDVILVMFIGVIGNCLFPIYLFQGLELMRNIAWISICSKTLMTILTFLLVRNSGDIINAAIVLTLPLLIPGVIAHFYIKKEKIATLNKVDISSVFNELKESAPLFISQVSISFYTTFNTLILGYFYSPTMVGLYSAADKLRVAVQSCYIPIQQVIFPKMNKENGTVGHKLFKYGGPFLIVSFFGSILVFVFGQKLATMYLGEDFSSSAILFKWMSILLFVIAVAIVYGQWGLITLGKEKTLTKIYVTGAFLHLFYTIPLMEKYSIFGMLTSVIITELVITFLMIIFFYIELRKIKSYLK